VNPVPRSSSPESVASVPRVLGEVGSTDLSGWVDETEVGFIAGSEGAAVGLREKEEERLVVS